MRSWPKNVSRMNIPAAPTSGIANVMNTSISIGSLCLSAFVNRDTPTLYADWG